MSLARIALRISAIEALRGRTDVGENIKDSPAGAIESQADGTLRTDEERPFINVYTRGSTAKEVGQRDLRQNGTIEFVLEFGIAAMLTETNDKGESIIVGIGIPASDEGFELWLDAIDRQIVNALTDPGNAWAEIWRKLSDGMNQIERRGAANEKGGTSFAARQIVVSLETKPDPVFGAPLTDSSVWSRFRAGLVEVRPDLVGILKPLFGPMAGNSEVTVGMIQRSRGHTAGEARALGYAPRFAGAPGAVIRGFTIEGGHVGSS